MTRYFVKCLVLPIVALVFAGGVFADEAFNRMIRAENWAEAIRYADDKIPPANRDAQTWANVGLAHENTGAPERALACYLVGINIDNRNYDVHLGAARVYNKMKQHDQAIEMARKAMELRMTGDASWEFAQACIATGKTADAKRALEKVVETDASNIVANRELGNIYYREKDFARALPLLKRSMGRQADSEVALRIAQAHRELNQIDSAIAYYNRAASDRSRPRPEVLIELARLHFGNKNYREAAANFERANRNALTGDDLFNWAFSLEQINADAKAINDAYAAAMAKYGNATSGNALIAREKVGRAAIARRAWREADAALAPVLRADPEARNVKDIYILMSQITDGQNNTNGTIAHLENAIRRDRNNVEAYARLADLYTRTRQADKAKTTMERLVALDPNNPKIHISLGQYHLSARKFEDALNSFRRAFTLEASPEAAIGMMNAAWNLRRYDVARDAAESALHRDPSLKEPQLMLVRIHMQEKNYRAARGVLLPLLQTEQNNLELWTNLAEVCEKTGDQAGLADADRRIVALDPKNVPSRMRIAKAAERAGDLRLAYETLKELAALQPRDADIHKSMYEIAVKQKNNREAIAHLRAYIALRPNDAAAHKDLGNLLFETRDMTGALASYRAAVRADSKITGLYKNYATILMSQNTPANELMPILVAAVTANEADEAIFTAAGNEYRKQSNWARAIEMYQKALALNARNVANLAALADCQHKAGNIAEAILSYEQVTTLNPQANAEFKALGDLYAQQNRMPQAVAAYKKYLEKTPTDVAIARVVGDFEFGQRRWAEANKYYAMVSGPGASQPDFLRNFGTSCFEAKNFARAAMLFKQLTDANPRDTAALKRLFEIEVQNKNNTGAINVLRRYVGVVPNDAAAQKTLGDMLYEARDQQGALAAYKAALAADPRIKGVHKRYVELVLRHGNATEQIAALNAAIAANESDAAMFAKLGELHIAANNCRAALTALERAAQMDPRNLTVQSMMADCHVKGGNINAAVVALEMVTAQNPNATNEFKMLGDLYVRQQKTPQAAAAYRRFLEKGGSDNAAARLVGETAFREKKWADAVRFLGMVRGQERNAQFLEMLGQAAFENKDNARAVDIYRQLATLAPQNADYVKMQYDLAVRMGARDDAATHLRRYLTLRPNDAAMQKTLGDMLFDRRDRTGALAAYRAALRADPQMKGIHRRVVELVEGTNGTPAERIAAMEAALAANEIDPPTLIKLGNMYVEQKQPAKAVPLFERAVAANPRDAQLLLALAQSQEAAGMIDQAIVTYERYVVMDNRAVAQHKTLGDLYTRQRKPAEALRSYRRFLERNPTDQAVALMVAREAYNAKQWSDAVRFFAMVTGPTGKTPEVLKMYGTAAYEAKDNPRALTVLQDLVKLTPRDPDVLKMLEEVCRRTGSQELAVTYLRQYCELRPQDVEAQRRLGDLLFDRKDEAGALAAYRAVLRADPAAKGFHRRVVSMVMKNGTDAEKMAALTAAIAAGEGDTPMFAALGEIHKKRNEFAKAAEMFDRASKADPRNAAYLTELADCQLKAGNVNAAAQTLQQAIMLNPRAVDEYKVLGDIQMQQRRPDQAMDSYRRFLDGTRTPDPRIAQLVGDHAFENRQWANAFKYLSMVPNNNTPQHLYRLGVSAQESGNSKAAIEALERFRTASRPANPRAQPAPNRTEGLRMLLAAYEKEKNNAKSAEIIEEILRGPPPVRDQELAYRRALMMEADNAERAMGAFEANTKDYPRDHRNFLKVGIHNTRRGGNAAKALQNLEQATRLADTISRAWFELGLLYGNANRNRDMMRAFEKFISLETRNADAIFRVGEYLMVTKRMPAEAMMFLEMSNALKPNDPKILPILASGYMQTGRIDEGVKILEQVVNRTRGTPVPIETRITLGDAYLTLGRNMDAANTWKMVTDQDRRPEYLIKYATALIAINNTSQAMNIANEILRQQPENVEALMLSGRVKVDQRNYEDAIETFKKVNFINDRYAPAYYERGNVLLMQQNFDQAKMFFERALRLDNKMALAELGLARVARGQRNQAEYQNRLSRAQALDPNNKEIQDELRRAGGGGR